MPAVITCTSANPRSQRPGSGTFRSTTVPSIVETVRSSGADRQVQRVQAADPGQRQPQRHVHVHVGGAVLGHLTVQAGRQHVHPGVHPAAAAERLEPQHVLAAGDDRVEAGRAAGWR